MGSADGRPDLDALRELEDVLRHLAQELAAWRRRALTAESLIADARDRGEGGPPRLRELEEANQALEQRLDAARSRLSELISRLDFLEVQALSSEPRGGPAK
jgi:predicted  nucleic acid-binding Zn-ribbon protein